MIILLVMALLLIGLISVVAQGLVGLYSSAGVIEQLQHEQRLGRVWEDAVMRNLLPAGRDGEYLAPIGSKLFDKNDHLIGHGLPDFVEAPKQNSLGVRLRYCALAKYGADPATSTHVSLTSSLSYAVEPITIGGRIYAYGAADIPGLSRNSPNVIAFIISPQKEYTDISCAGIQYDETTGRYRLPDFDATVLPILAPHVCTP